MITKKCLICGKEFETWNCRIKIGCGRFCSQKCVNTFKTGKTLTELTKIKIGQSLKGKYIGEKCWNWKGGKITRNCFICHKEFSVNPSVIKFGGGKFCSRQCHYKFQKITPNKGWFKPGIRGTTNGRYRHKKTGYIWIYKPDYSNYQSVYVPEHKLVMEEKIGRRLTSGEVVHHINRKPADNRPGNLYLFSSRGAHNRYERNLLTTYRNWIWAEYNS